MKQPHLITWAGWLPLLMASCDRSTVNDAILTMGVNAASQMSMLSRTESTSPVGTSSRRVDSLGHAEGVKADGIAGSLEMDFEGPLHGGGRLRLSSLRGKPVLVTFWASPNPECRAELLVLKQIRDQLGDEGVRFVGVALDGDQVSLGKFLAAAGIDWPQIFSDKPEFASWNNPIAAFYQVKSVPETFLVDENGVIVAAKIRGQAQIVAALGSLAGRVANGSGSEARSPIAGVQ